MADGMSLDGMIFGMPPGTHVSDNVMLNSMPTAEITPCEPKFSKGLSLFTLDPGKGLEKYQEILKSVGFSVTGPSIKVAYLADSFPTDTFNNDYGETFLDKFAQVASSGLGDLAQIAGWTNAEQAKSQMDNIGQAIGGKAYTAGKGFVGDKLKSVMGALSPSNQKMAKSVGKTMESMLTGGRIDFPQVWKNSSFQPSYSMTIRLYNPDPSSDEATKRYIVGPIAALVSLGVPKVGEDASTYKWPLMCKIKSPGLYELPAAYINSIAVIKGGDQQSIAYNQNMAMCDVRIDFGSLYNSILAGANSSNFSADRPTLGSYLEAIGGNPAGKVSMGKRDIYEIHNCNILKKAKKGQISEEIKKKNQGIVSNVDMKTPANNRVDEKKSNIYHDLHYGGR